MYKLTKEHAADTSAVRPHVAALGEILWDVYPSGKQLGGAPANFIYHASRMRTRSHMISRIGRDKLGQEIIAVLQEAGLSSEFIGEDERHPTGTVQVSVASDGQPDFTITKNAAWDFLEWREDLDRLAVAVDTVGAGDAFTAALTVGCLKAWDLDKISRIANLVASQVCLHQGAWMPGELFVHEQRAKD